jgi:hypothetical protein
LYFHSLNRPGGKGSFDLWVSQRASINEPWGTPVNLGIVNTVAIDANPALSRDEHWLFFQSTRNGGFGGLDIWVSYRQHIHDDLGWQPAVNIGDGVNSAFSENASSYLENDDAGGPQLFFHSDRPGGLAATDVYVSTLLPDGTFPPAVLIPELSSAGSAARASVARDGLAVFFFSDRPGGVGSCDLWMATRETVFDAWSTPTNLGGPVNTNAIDAQPYIAADHESMYFVSTRPGGFGSQDLWVTTRTKKHP